MRHLLIHLSPPMASKSLSVKQEEQELMSQEEWEIRQEIQRAESKKTKKQKQNTEGAVSEPLAELRDRLQEALLARHNGDMDRALEDTIHDATFEKIARSLQTPKPQKVRVWRVKKQSFKLNSENAGHFFRRQ
jgi:hypothetical protein